ncbi:MAG: DUF882 domain-containing protein [Rhizobiaceae bacterium]|nr:DUF882 domain-containing protein [Rhizobiaceae bacterium]
MTSIQPSSRRRDAKNTRWTSWLAGLAVVFASLVSSGLASAETRSLKLYFIHTGEKAEIVFKRNGVYDQAGLKKINQFLRDWRRNEPTRMDPRLFDLVWEVYRAVGASNYINVVSAYRSPATNSMLRSRSNGVAKKSQHMLGKAMDFFIPGVSLKKLRETGMKMQVGGVGYYPRSGSPFVHMDVGNVRHWPKMSRRELVALFPNGKTLHVPSDGKPLPGYDQAMASYQARKAKGTSALALASSGSGKSSSKGFFAALFGGGADDEEDSAESEAPVVAKKAQPAKPVAVAKAAPADEPQAAPAGIQVVSPKDAKRVDLPVALDPEPEAPAPVVETPESIIAALPARSIPLPALAPRPGAEVATVALASAAEIAPPQASAQPDNIPFGMAQEEAATIAESAVEAPAAASVAFNVPLPTPRPQLARDAAPADAIAALAMAAEADTTAPLAAFAGAPLPAMRPSEAIEAMPSSRPGLPVPPSAEARDAQALAAAQQAARERVAALASVADDAPRLSTASIVPSENPTKTTRKSARASAGDGKPERKSRVVAAEPADARWVMSGDQVANLQQGTTAPSFAYNAVVTAPREVYTAGFHKSDVQVDASRFSGKAVEFLSVARFE